MKKILLTILLGLNLVQAQTIPTNTKLSSHSYSDNMDSSFLLGNSMATCRNNVVYYTTGSYNNPTIIISYNSKTKEPYYCSLGKLEEIQDDRNIFGIIHYTQLVTIHHTSEELPK